MRDDPRTHKLMEGFYILSKETLYWYAFWSPSCQELVLMTSARRFFWFFCDTADAEGVGLLVFFWLPQPARTQDREMDMQTSIAEKQQNIWFMRFLIIHAILHHDHQHILMMSMVKQIRQHLRSVRYWWMRPFQLWQRTACFYCSRSDRQMQQSWMQHRWHRES